MLSIIIVNYKSEGKTINYVKKELRNVITPHIIVVVNNSATLESNKTLVNGLGAELVTDINVSPSVNRTCFILPHLDNLGFAKGNNLGATFSLKHFKITHFLFSNNDIRFIHNNVVESLMEKLEELDDFSLIGPKVIGINGKNQSPEPYISIWNRYVWMYWLTPFLSKRRKNKIFKIDYPQYAKEGKHYKIMGSFFLMKANDFMACGMMDPNTFLFGEEVILSERLSSIGKHVYFYPEVTVVHEHGHTISQHVDIRKKMRMQFESESYYYSKYRKVSKLSILIGRISLKFYMFLKIR